MENGNKIKLASFSSLLKGSVNDFKERIKTTLALSGLYIAAGTVFAMILAVAFVLGIINIYVGVAVGIIAGLALFFSSLLVQGAFMYAMKDGAKLKESFSFIWKNKWSYLWIAFLTFLVITPGLIALIVPGIVLSMFISFAIFIFIDSGSKGMEAIAKSVKLVKGHFWPVFGRLILSALVAMGAGMVVSIVGGLFNLVLDGLGGFIENLFSTFVVMPIAICFSWRLFKDLKEKKPEALSAPVKKATWVKVMAIIGAVIIVGMTTVLIVFLPAISQAIESEVNSQNPTSEIIDGNRINIQTP